MIGLTPHHRDYILKTTKRLDSSFFFYDLDGLENHLRQMDQLLGEHIELWYACKANPLSAILKVFRNNSFGIDVASKGELDQALRSGVRPNQIISTGPCKSRQYLGELLDEDVETIVCESLNQVYWLDQISESKGKKPKVLLRLQLDWGEGESVLGGNQITPFGEDAEHWLNLDFSKTKNIDIIGLHVFQWGNILEEDQLAKIWRKIAIEVQELAQKLGIKLKIIDLGGGLGIPYADSERELDLEKIKQILLEIKNDLGLERIWMELGRYAVGPYGHYYTKVVDRKHVRGKDLLILEGGMNHIARPALTGQPFPTSLLRESNQESTSFQLHGPLCTALDFLGESLLPKDIGPGDWLGFHQAGAYGFTEGLSFFLCHHLPAEVILYQENLMIPRNPKKPHDWLV